jgi:hypothetical protein
MALHRLIHAQCNPSYRTVHRVLEAIELGLGRPVYSSDIISYSGYWPTSICSVCGCSGCLPERAYIDDGSLRPEFQGLKPRTWSLLNI